jgi:hypothetical protein
MMSGDVIKEVRPKELFDMLQIKDVEEAERVFKYAFEFLAYISVGDIIQTPQGDFEKLSDDLIHISTSVNKDDMLNTLEKRRIIKFLF